MAPVDLGRSLDRIPFCHPRFPACFPGPGGATPPCAALKGLETAIRDLRKGGLPDVFPINGQAGVVNGQLREKPGEQRSPSCDQNNRQKPMILFSQCD